MDEKAVLEHDAEGPIDGPSELFFVPFSFLLAGTTRRPELTAARILKFKMLYLDEPDYDLHAMDARIARLQGKDQPPVRTDGKASEYGIEWHLFSNKPPASPKASEKQPSSEYVEPFSPIMKLWISEEGILLSATDPERNKEFIRLVQFKKFADF